MLVYMTSKCNALHLNQVVLLEVKTFLGVLFILSFLIPSFDPGWNPPYFLLLMGKPWRHILSGTDSRNDHLIILSFLWYWENEYWPKSSHGLRKNSIVEGYLEIQKVLSLWMEILVIISERVGSPWAKSSSPTVYFNKVLLEHIPSDLFSFCLLLLSHQNRKLSSCHKDYNVAKPKILTVIIEKKKKFAKSWFEKFVLISV